MNLNKDLLVGMFVLGVLSHYGFEEIQKDKGINYIAMTLRKKHFDLKNGNADVRLWSEQEYVKKQIKRNPKRRVEYIKKSQKAFSKRIELRNSWEVHAKISDSAWKKATLKFNADNAITTNQLLSALLRKNDSTVKWYSFNKKKIDKILHPNPNRKDNYIMASSRVATALMNELESEIAYYYYNNMEKTA